MRVRVAFSSKQAQQGSLPRKVRARVDSVLPKHLPHRKYLGRLVVLVMVAPLLVCECSIVFGVYDGNGGVVLVEVGVSAWTVGHYPFY